MRRWRPLLGQPQTWKKRWGQLAKRWHITTLEIRLFAIMWPLGIALFALGLYADATTWWDSRPFVLELSGSLTGVLIGIPLAVAVLQRVQSHTAEEILRATTQRRAHIAAQRFTAAVVESYCLRGFPDGYLPLLGNGELEPIDVRALGDLHWRTTDVAGQVVEARELLTHPDQVHDVMTALANELDGGVRPPHPHLVGLGELLFETARGLVRLGEAFSVAEALPGRYDLWRKQVVPNKDKAFIDLGAPGWETNHFKESKKLLDELWRFYGDVSGVLMFAQLVLWSTTTEVVDGPTQEG